MAKKINIVCTFEPCETSTSKITLVRTFSGPNLCDASVLEDFKQFKEVQL